MNYLDHEKNLQQNTPISNDSKNGDSLLSPDYSSSDQDKFEINLSQNTTKTSSLIGEDSDYKVASELADINPRDVTEKEEKTHGKVSDSGSIIVFKENPEQMPGTVEDIDGRVVMVKMAVTTRQKTKGGASGNCQLQTLEKNSEATKSTQPYHLTASASSILTVNNDAQPSGNFRIMCKVKEDFPDVEPSISSQTK